MSRKNKLSQSIINIITHPDRIIFNFSSSLKEQISKLYNDYNHFYKNYKIDYKVKNDFIDILKTKTIEYDNDELNSDWIYIENRLKAELASSLWGKQFLFKTNIKLDEQVQAVYNYFNEATQLIDVH